MAHPKRQPISAVPWKGKVFSVNYVNTNRFYRNSEVELAEFPAEKIEAQLTDPGPLAFMLSLRAGYGS